MTTTTDIKTRLLDAGEELCQLRGFNAFSYQHLADALDIDTAAIEEHFPTKADLGRELMRRYRDRLAVAVQEIDADTSDPLEKLSRYGDGFIATFRNGGRLCLCASFASDVLTLPDEIREEVQGYFDDNEKWLTRVLKEGRDRGRLHFEGGEVDLARSLFNALEGAMLAARTYSSQKRLQDTKRWILVSLLGGG